MGQHIRDQQLMKSLIEYLGCGKVYQRGELVNFMVTKFNDLDKKLIPLFEKYPIIGVKFLDYLDFFQALKIVKNKAHLTREGLDRIHEIKARMTAPISVADGRPGIKFSITNTSCREDTKEHVPISTASRPDDTKTKLKISTRRVNPVNIFEKCSSEGFKLIGNFASAKKAGLFLGISNSTVNKYINSGSIYKERYKFSCKSDL